MCSTQCRRSSRRGAVLSSPTRPSVFRRYQIDSAVEIPIDELGEVAVRKRREALAALHEYLKRADRDPARILGAGAAQAADAVLAVGDPYLVTDLRAAHALRWYHWMRFAVLPDESGERELATAVGYLTLVFPVDPESLPEEVRSAFEEKAATSPDAGSDPDMTTARAIGLANAYHRTGQPALLEQAVTYFRAAVAAAAPDHPDRCIYLHNLGSMLSELFNRTGDPDTLRAAVEVSKAAVTAAPADHPDHATYLYNLGRALLNLSQWTDDQGTLAEAVRVGREAAAEAPADHVDRAAILNSLGITFNVLAERTGRLEVLKEALEVLRAAADADATEDRAAILAISGARSNGSSSALGNANS